MQDPDHPPFAHTQLPYMFSTPLRSLVSKDLTNLFFAGRLQPPPAGPAVLLAPTSPFVSRLCVCFQTNSASNSDGGRDRPQSASLAPAAAARRQLGSFCL